MAKLKTESIQTADMVEFLDSYSDFSFELSVLKMLRENEIECEHGGLYEDPVTGKSREFDIRAIKTISNYRIRLAVECKNIRKYCPILISCIPRHEHESYHQIALVGEQETSNFPLISHLYKSRAKTISIRGKHSIYKPQELVGKSTVQIGRALDGSISANDSDLYDKWSQCLSSSTDLIAKTYWNGDDESQKFYLSLVVPIVVVPNGRLWSVAYDDDGNRVSDPIPSDRCSCFIGKDYEMGTKMAGTKMWISHVEIVTFDGLQKFVASNLSSEDGISEFFSNEGIEKAIELEDE